MDKNAEKAKVLKNENEIHLYKFPAFYARLS